MTSFVLFAVGAIIPVIPFVFLAGALVLSVVSSALSLCAISALITLLTGRSVLFSGTRQVLVVLAAAVLTHGAGSLIGTALPG